MEGLKLNHPRSLSTAMTRVDLDHCSHPHECHFDISSGLSVIEVAVKLTIASRSIHLRFTKDANAIHRCSSQVFHRRDDRDGNGMASALGHRQQGNTEHRSLDFMMDFLQRDEYILIEQPIVTYFPLLMPTDD